MKYHNSATRLAPAPRDFHEQLAALARRLLSSAIGIPPADRRFLQDLARSDVRYPMNTLRRLNSIAARSVKPEDREGPAELVRADILAQTERAFGVVTVFDAENAANDWTDRTQWKLERALQTRTLSSAVIEECELAFVQQLATTRDAIDVVRSLRPEARV